MRRLFAADACVTPVAIAYGRSSLLRERLLAAAELRVAVEEQNAIVIDPDSRLTQLGLMPICDDSRYFFFESRAFGGESGADASGADSGMVGRGFRRGTSAALRSARAAGENRGYHGKSGRRSQRRQTPGRRFRVRDVARPAEIWAADSGRSRRGRRRGGASGCGAGALGIPGDVCAFTMAAMLRLRATSFRANCMRVTILRASM